jgi:hypothetical protein
MILKQRKEINGEKQRWRIYHNNNIKDKSISIFSKGIRISSF